MFGKKKINLLVTGAKGQLGSYLVDYFTKKSFMKKSRVGKVFGIDVEELDIQDANAVVDFFNNAVDPHIDIDYVIHCAAATNTSAIEDDPSAYYAVNCLGTRNIAESCACNGVKMVFISSDYVLSEKSPKFGTHLQEFPVNQYGLQKLIAEQFAKEAYRDKPRDLMVLRSSWMFGNSDHSFVEKLLANIFHAYAAKKSSDEEVAVKVAGDAWGRPTPVWFIADTIESLVMNNMHGTMDLQYPWPQTTRYEWAKMIWNAFVNARHFDNSNSDHDVVKELKAAVKIVSADSAELGGNMHHPGKIDMSVAEMPLPGPYELDTIAYVEKNWTKYVKMANSILKPIA